MPPRWLCWLIGMFWVTMMGWLFWRDLWPNWRPGEPPPFQIDDVEEVHGRNRNPTTTAWTVFRQVGANDPVKVFGAKTWVEYDKEADDCTLNAKFTAQTSPSSPPVLVGKIFKIASMTSEYRVDRAGRLLSLEAEVKATPRLEDFGKDGPPLLRQFLNALTSKGRDNLLSSEPVTLRIWGEVQGDQFWGHCRVSDEHSNTLLKLDLRPAAVSNTGSVLMPLHPVNHLSGLRPGQSWHQPQVDPLRDAFGLANGVRSLNALVLPQPQVLKTDDAERPCLVIEYTNDENEMMGRTWVEQSSNRVLQQEAIVEKDHWIMQRDLGTRPSHRQFGPADQRHRGIKHD